MLLLSFTKDCPSVCDLASVSRPEQGLAPGPPTANNFLKGASFSPDGTCLLTSSDDTVLRVFEVPNHVLHGVRLFTSFIPLVCTSGQGGNRSHLVDVPAGVLMEAIEWRYTDSVGCVP